MSEFLPRRGHVQNLQHSAGSTYCIRSYHRNQQQDDQKPTKPTRGKHEHHSEITRGRKIGISGWGDRSPLFRFHATMDSTLPSNVGIAVQLLLSLETPSSQSQPGDPVCSGRCHSFVNRSTSHRVLTTLQHQHLEFYLRERKMEPNIYCRFIDVNILS